MSISELLANVSPLGCVLHLDDEVLTAHPILGFTVSGDDPATLHPAVTGVRGVAIGENKVTIEAVLVLVDVVLDHLEIRTTEPGPVRSSVVSQSFRMSMIVPVNT